MATRDFRHLRCTTEQGVRVLVITVSQIRDDETTCGLRDELLEAAGDSDLLVVDFQHIKELSSMAFRPLLTLRRAVAERGGRLLLCGLAPAVEDVFTTTQLIGGSGTTALFEVAPDVPTAVARLVGASP